MIKRSLVTVGMATTLLLSPASGIFASEIGGTDTAVTAPVTLSDLDDLSQSELNDVADQLDVTPDEVANLDDNLNDALADLPDDGNGDVQVSDNLVLSASTEEDTDAPTLGTSNGMSVLAKAATKSVQWNSTLQLKNIIGVTIITLKGHGIFSYNGSTVKPTDAWGDYTGILWELNSKKSVKSGSGSTAYVRTQFTGKLNVGVSSVSAQIAGFSKTNIITVNKNGKLVSSKW